MIRCDHKDILILHFFQDARQLLVKISQRFRIAVHIIPVSVKHIIVHQIDKTKSVKITIHPFYGLLNAVRVSVRADEIRDPLSRKDIIDLSDRKHIISRVL